MPRCAYTHAKVICYALGVDCIAHTHTHTKYTTGVNREGDTLNYGQLGPAHKRTCHLLMEVHILRVYMANNDIHVVAHVSA